MPALTTRCRQCVRTACRRPGVRLGPFLCAAACGALLIVCPAALADAPAGPAPAVAAAPVGAVHAVLWYLPNRVLDLLDLFRIRLRLGPGLAADVRATRYAANFIGTYEAVYAGLPGPRRAPDWPHLAGREAARGLMIMGVDATDDSDHPPRYADTELVAGAQVLAAGAVVGFDPYELGDFLAGWLTFDPRADDH